MDVSRSVKRVALILVLAIIVIFVSKALLSKAAKNLRLEAEKKQQAKASKPEAVPAILAPDPIISVGSAPEAGLEASPQSAPSTDSPVAGQ